MKTMAISKFKAHALKVLNEVAKSQETIVITKRGKPLAQVVPYRIAGLKRQKKGGTPLGLSPFFNSLLIEVTCANYALCCGSLRTLDISCVLWDYEACHHDNPDRP